MTKYFFSVALLIFLTGKQAVAQYYYKDVLSVLQATSEKNIWRQQKIRNVQVHSFEGDGTPSEGFYCEKKISKDYSRIETYTRSTVSKKDLLVTYYNSKGLLEKSSDSSEINSSTTLYDYNDKGDVTSITSFTHSSDEDFSTSLKEVHQYIYNAKGQPEQMLRIRNDRDTTGVLFTLDAKGNVTDEIESGKNGIHYYYYYNTKNQLTDIVKYNAVKGGLRADFSFEYDDEGQTTQMITVEEGPYADYYTWKYVYNEGLKIIEKCFAKSKFLVGYLEYEYD